MSDRYLNKTEVIERVRLSDPTIYRLRRKRKFPEPIMIGERKIAWLEADIEEWLRTRKRVSVAAPAEAA